LDTGISFGSQCSPFLIFDVADKFKMCRVAAEAVIAPMIYLLFTGDVAVVMGKHNQMNGYRLAV
jgi:hypothetical protein